MTAEELARDRADSARIDWLEKQARRSRTGISFDFAPSVDGERGGFRFMRRFFLGEARDGLRAAIDSAMRAEPTFVDREKTDALRTAEELARQLVSAINESDAAGTSDLRKLCTSALHAHGKAEFARGWAAGQEAMRERAAIQAVIEQLTGDPPDDWEDDGIVLAHAAVTEAAKNIAAAIRVLPIEPAPAERAAALSRLAEIDGPLIMDEPEPKP